MADRELRSLEPDVGPPEREQFALTEAGREGKDVEHLESITCRGVEELPGLCLRERDEIMTRRRRRRYERGDVARDETPGGGLFQRFVEKCVDVPDRHRRGTGFQPLRV